MSSFDGLLGEDFATAWQRPRDISRPVMLIGYQDEENLGLGYLSATLRRFGYRVLVFNFNADRDEILAAVHDEKPLLIGLSLIFQFYLPRFAELARTLREGGGRLSPDDRRTFPEPQLPASSGDDPGTRQRRALRGRGDTA